MGALLYQTLRESIVDAIRSKIFNHEIKPGQRIVELELAKEFHTSRGPIREALRQLENEGIIVYTRNVGCSVRELSFQDSYEVYLLRTNYEVVSVRFQQGNISEETMRHLKEILERMKNLTAREFDQVFACDNEFHEELVKMCGMPRLQKAWKEQYYGNLFAGYDLVQDKEAVAKRQYASHKVIFDACVSGDCEAICKAIKDHYWRTIAGMMRDQNVDDPRLQNAWEHTF